MEYAKEGDIADGNNEYAIGDNGSNKPLAEGNNNDNDEYAKDGNIAANDDKYVIGNDSVDEALAKGDDEYDTLSAAHPQACPESQWASLPSR